MQAEYPNKLPRTNWDPVFVEYSVRRFPDVGKSSETIAHKWRTQPEILKETKEPIAELKEYFKNYNVEKDLWKSQTIKDFEFKLAETRRYNKHNACTDNSYIYPTNRRLADRPPQCSAHAKSEMQRSYIAPEIKTRLITNKEQFLGPLLSVEQPPAEPSWHKDYEPLDTTHEGFEKYLDPYLTSSRLHHRPFTVEQLNKKSSSSDIITYYTCADIPWTRTPAPKTEQWKPPNRPKSTYDREKFKEGFREIRTHNKLKWVPGTFRTEMRDKYSKKNYLDPIVHSNEEEVRSFYENTLSKLRTNITEEHSAYFKKYKSENTQYGLRKPICSVLDQHKEKNKKLERKNEHSF